MAEDHGIAGNGLGHRSYRHDARLWQAEISEIGRGKARGQWKEETEALAVFRGDRQRFTVSLHQPAEQSGRGRHGDLLTEDRAHREFEAIPGSRYPQARPRRHQWRQHRVKREMRPDGVGIGGKIEHPAHPRDDLGQRRHIGKPHRDVDPVLAGRVTLTTPLTLPIAIVRR